MSTTTTDPGRHPLLAEVAALAEGLDETAGWDPRFCTTAEKEELLVGLARLRDRLEVRLAETLAVAGDVAQEHGARTAGAWLARRRNLPVPAMRRIEGLGQRLADRPVAREAAAAGAISPEHARAVCEAVAELPDDLPGCETREDRDALLTRAERDLVKLSGDHTPAEVRRLGRRILEVVDPEAADEIERQLLEAEERQARAKTRLHLGDLGDGRTRIRGEIPTHTADILRKALAAYTNPRRNDSAPDPGAAEDRPRSFTQRQGQAFCTLIEHLLTDRLPTHGGTPVTVVVTIDHDKLRNGLGAAQLDTGQRLSAAAVRRMACAHGILPAVLDSHGRVLDLGRRQRFFTTSQRIAHTLTHPTCQAAGCDIPAAWCESHHRGDPWAAGGTTNQTDLAFLCTFHHHHAHDTHTHVTWSTSGEARFHRRE